MPLHLCQMTPVHIGTINHCGLFAPSVIKPQRPFRNGKNFVSVHQESNCIRCRGWVITWRSSNGTQPGWVRLFIGRRHLPSIIKLCSISSKNTERKRSSRANQCSPKNVISTRFSNETKSKWLIPTSANGSFSFATNPHRTS